MCRNCQNVIGANNKWESFEPFEDNRNYRIDHDKESNAFYIYHGLDHIKINNCPVCGRKL